MCPLFSFIKAWLVLFCFVFLSPHLSIPLLEQLWNAKMTVPLPCLKFLCVYSWFYGEGGNSQSFNSYTELFRGLFILLYYTVCFLKCSTQAVTKYHFLSCLFISGCQRSEHAVSSTENETFQHMCLLHCFANAYSCFRNHWRVISSRKYSLISVSQGTLLNPLYTCSPPKAP